MTGTVEIANIERFRSIIAKRLGLNFDESKIGFLGEVLRRGVDRKGCSCQDYLDLLNTSQAELNSLAQELTVGETYFFRNIDQFRAFSEVALLDRLRVRASQKRLRILSAGCASGEEAYSLAILLSEAALDRSWDVSILAVDVNPAMIDAAVKGRFSSWALRETPPEVRRQWLRSENRGLFSTNAALRRNIRFEVRNLVDDRDLWQPESYDVIFCRNVIMYLTAEASRHVVAGIARSLTPGGFLFLGSAETLRGLSQDFHLHHTHNTFYYRRRETGSPHISKPATAAPMPSFTGVTPQPAIFELEGADTWMDIIRKSTERIQALAEARATRSETDDLANTKLPKWDLAAPLDLLRKEHFNEALDVIQALPAESGGDPDVLLLHAVLLAHRGQFKAAQEVCGRLLAIDELNAGAHYVLALSHEGLGNRSEVTNHDQVAVYLDSTFAMPHLHLGLIARRTGDRETAQQELERALMLLQREDASRLLLFGGGFSRDALIALCRAELTASGGIYEH